MTTPVTTNGTAAPKATDTSSLAGKAVLGKDDFLRILVTQLRNQDPLNPMEGTEFATQLAQFSSVEQLIQMGEAMTASTAATTELKLTAQTTLGASMVGRDVLLDGAKVTVDGSDPSRVTFDLGTRRQDGVGPGARCKGEDDPQPGRGGPVGGSPHGDARHRRASRTGPTRTRSSPRMSTARRSPRRPLPMDGWTAWPSAGGRSPCV
ncbi:MAG: flagellar hook capping FlgD N-terminal domain-containing protein [Gemmatimonadales bacterium]